MKKAIITYAIVLLALLAVGQPEGPLSDAEKEYLAQVQRSLDVLNKALLQDSANHYLYYLKSSAEISLGLIEEAEKSLDKAYELNPLLSSDELDGETYYPPLQDEELYDPNVPVFPEGIEALGAYLSSAGLPKSLSKKMGEKVMVKTTITLYGNAYVDMADAESILDSLAYEHVFRMPLWEPTHNYSSKGYDTILEVTFTEELNENDTYQLPKGMEADTVAQFVGGLDELMKYMGKVTNYPPFARENDIEGTVYLSFIIDETGKVKDIKIVRSAADVLNKEAIRVIKQMPPWIPAMKDGVPVPFEHVIPVKFKLG